MIQNNSRLCAVFAAATLLSTAGCSKVSTAQAVQFNDALVEASHRVTLAGREFGVAAGKAIGGGVMEVAKVKREHENMVEALERAQAEMKVIRVPDSPSARKLFEEFRKMMVVMDEVVREDFKSIVKVLEDPLLTPQERLKKLVPLVNYIRSLDLGEKKELKQAQSAFAAEFGFAAKSFDVKK
jgi:hypothetical protein